MKKKLLNVICLSLCVVGFSNVFIAKANADEEYVPSPAPTEAPIEDITPTPTEVPEEILEVSSIEVIQYPSKMTYRKGEDFDTRGMIVEGYYSDGSSAIITDYEVIGYNKDQIGQQTIMILYQNKIAVFNVEVLQGIVTNIQTSYRDTTTISLTWDEVSNALKYEIYELDQITGEYTFVNEVYSNSITLNYSPGTIHTYVIYSFEELLGTVVQSDASEEYTTATLPEAVTNLVVTATGTNSITLAWDPVIGATGYMIYRSTAGAEDYVLAGTTSKTTFFNNKLVSGKSYNYKVVAYTLDANYTGDFSNVVDTSTNPGKVTMKYKVGEEKVRFSWSKVNGATSYELYMGDSINGFTLVANLPGNSKTYTHVVEGLTIGNTYTFYAVARKDYKGTSYCSLDNKTIDITIKPVEPTSTVGKLFPTDKAFLNSWSYKSLDFFRTYVNVEKSIPIPGLKTTNVGGFTSTTMVPQGLTFAKNYLLMSAYDSKSEENSVIYVLNKKTKELLTTLILPSKPHAGGMAFDGKNVWVTIGSKLAAITYSDIHTAARRKAPYTYINYSAVCPVSITASYVAYYDKKLWVGTYNELQATNLYSYRIDTIDEVPTLTEVDTMIMPTRVQGIVITSKGTVILSRSCQLHKGLRGYMRQLDVYKPDWKKTVNGVISLGDPVNTVSMPSMNEDIAIDGSYLYVTFESGAFEKSTYKMDRICAFKVTDVVKKTSNKK